MKKNLTRILSLLLVLVLMVGVLPVSALADGWDLTGELDTEQLLERAEPVEMQSKPAVDGYDYSIMFLDCGRKYYSVGSIKQLIDKASAAGFNYIQLAVGNDGLRLLLDDMSLTVGTTYTSKQVSDAIHAGNLAYNARCEKSDPSIPYNPVTNELTEAEMDTIIAYANSKDMGVIPCVNTPGHMDAILYAASSLTGKDCSYNGSVRTIDVTNATAVAFTQALLQKYITYFAGKGCKLFNMGADEYANDRFTTGAMGFGNLINSGNYKAYGDYVNAVAKMIKDVKMTPMAFNDGIYFWGNTSCGKIDTDIIICYWSSGWGYSPTDYKPTSASNLASMGFKMVNTHGDYYWVLGKTNAQCDAEKASKFNVNTFPGSTISDPVGAMFCIWADYPGAETEDSVISKTADTIAAFGGTLPETKPGSTTPVFKVVGDVPNGGTLTMGSALTLRVPEGMTAIWTASPVGIVELTAPVATRSTTVTANSVNVTPLKAGDVTITATNPENESQKATFALTVSDPDAPVTETVTLTVGQEVTRTQDGDLHGTYTPNPAGVASVNVTAEPVAGEITYAPVTSLTAGTFYVSTEANDKTPTVTLTLEDAGNGQYYLKDSSGQYIYPNASWSFGWLYSRGTGNEAVSVVVNNGGIAFKKHHTYNGFFGNDETDAYLKLSGSTFGATGSITSLYLYTKETQPAGWKSTITFKGLAVGNTTVKIGDVTYNITVTEENLETVTSLSVEYWITNARIYTETNGSNGTGSTGKQISAAEAYDQNGYALSDLIQKNAFTNSAKKAVFWKGTLHPADNKQTTNSGDDKTNMGTDFQYVRYWDASWSYSNDRTTWTEIDLTNQVVAYYMQVTEVTDEVTTTVVDWGENPFGTALNYLRANFILLDFAVKYESGERSPDEFPVEGKTIGFHCDGVPKRTLGRITPFPSDTHEVYMITLTPSDDNPNAVLSSSSAQNAVSKPYTYSGTEKVVWVDKEEDLGKFDDESLHHTDFKVGGEATIANGVTIYKGQGVLVTYYIRAKQTESSLTVHYFDMDTSTEFYNYQIAVMGNTVFDSNIGLDNPWKGPLMEGTVTNSLGKTQTVSADLSTMPAIGANYQYSDYTCQRVERSADGKEVTLYYTFNNTTSFVVDFGLPLVITADDLNYNNTQWQTSTVRGAHYGNAVLDKVNHTLTYTLTKPLPEPESLQLTVTDSTGSNTRNINIFPASNVLYEENFLTPYAKDPANLPAWTSDTSSQLTGQSQSTHKNDASVRYGYDNVYGNIVGRNGAWTIQGLNAENNVSQALYTEFYGNALDVIGSCGRNTAQVMFLIYNQTTRKAKSVLIDTRYNGTTLEQVPYSHIELPGGDAHYNVMIRAYYAPAIAASNTNTATTFGAVSAISDFAASASYADQAVWDQMARDLASFGLTLDDVEFIRFADTPAAQTDSFAVYTDLYSVQQPARQEGTNLAIDAFRVYRSASTIHTVPKNYLGSEQNIEYWNILDLVDGEIVKAYTENGTVESVTVEAYEAKGGPLDEIYLENGQSVAFKVENAGATIQVSLRAVTNTAAQWATSENGGTVSTISTNTEMYYTVKPDASGNVTIANRGNALLAIGNVKLPSGAKTMSASEIDEDALRASLCAALGLSAEQPQAFQPKTFTARATTLPMLRNKRVSVLITISNDVSYVTVNGVKYTPSRYYASWQKTRLIQFGETLGKYESKTYTIIAYDANGVASAPITVNG